MTKFQAGRILQTLWFRAAAVAVGGVLLFGGACRAPGPTSPLSDARRVAGLPSVMLWAWERPERLTFIDPRTTGVAFHAQTLRLRGEAMVVQPRMQPLDVLPETKLVAVTRLEKDPLGKPAFTPTQRTAIVREVLKTANRPTISVVQIDFDAFESERRAYRDLLTELRRALPPTVGLSITAFASWCMDDPWIADLPVDEFVPMLFRMGPDAGVIRKRLNAGEDFRNRACGTSIGVSADEPIPTLPAGRRLYLFHPKAWTPAALAAILKDIQK